MQYKNQHPVDADALARAINKVETEATRVAWERNPHAARFEFSEEHREALAHITRESGDIAVLSGLAGVGKTLCLAAARLAWQEEGFVVVGTAVAGKAAGSLREEAGIPSMTVEKLTLLIKSGQSPLTARSILVVDEASMVSTQQMATIVSAVQASASKLVLVGDPKQLQAIEAGGSFLAVEKRIGSASLKTIVRQEIDKKDKSPYWRRQVVLDFANGNAIEALRALDERAALHIENGGRSGAMKALVQVWQERGVKSPHENLIFAGLRDEVRELNRLAQDARRSAGQLGFRSVHVGNVEICEKDRVLVTRRDVKRSVENSDVGTVVAIERAANTLSVKLDRGAVVSIDYKNFKHLALGYAMTGHKAQGQTTKNSFVLCGGSMADREMAYVLASRARQETHFFSERIMAWDSDKGVMVDKTLSELGRQLSQSRQATLAHDVALDQATRNPVEQQESLGKAANQNLIPER